VSRDERPPLCRSGHVLVVSASYPPHPGGSSVLMRNLLSRFHPASYSVASRRHADLVSIEQNQGEQVHSIESSIGFSSTIDRRWQDWDLSGMTSRLVGLVGRIRPRVLLGVYPDFHFLSAAREAALQTKTPWVAYLHDTLAEGLSNSRLADRAALLQKQVFGEASRILVMSRGMADLYLARYRLSSVPLEHSYLDPIPDHPPDDAPPTQAFWGGAIYGINTRAVSRVAKALAIAQYPFVLATNTTISDLARLGVQGEHLRIEFYSKRSEYLRVLQQQGLLVLALDWPDESPVHEDELATIFPTKTPEYLASGRPILVHCPEHYFLARFFMDHRCGLIVSDRSLDCLVAKIQEALKVPEAVSEMTRLALSAARLFAADRVASVLQCEVEKAASVQWGERSP
jgi:glycosyltransferase involved in cell wall biosynthesis